MSLVTILIPVYNTEKYISKAIESIINQTFQDWTLLVLDDCSTDNTYDIVLKYAAKDRRIQALRNEKNLGMMPNWNKGLSLCKGEYWGKLDADDYWAPTMIEKSIQILENNKNVALVCSKYQIVDENNIVKNPPEIPNFAKNKEFSCIDLVKLGPQKMFQYNILRQGIGLMRRSFFEQTSNFNILDNGDTEMWYRIGAHYNIYCIDEVLHYHRIWSESFMRKNSDNNEYRRNVNFYEVRKHILEYYFSNNFLSKKEFKFFIKENRFIFNSYLIYFYRKKYHVIKTLYYLLSNFFMFPQLTLLNNLNFNRLLKK